MAEKKNNMATRFCDEIIGKIRGKITSYRDNACVKSNEAAILHAQADALEYQIGVIEDSLQQGNYESAQS